MKKEHFLYNCDKINKVFLKCFKQSYIELGKNTVEDKSVLLSRIELVYRRWLYSPFIAKTFLSPACIFNSLNHFFDERQGFNLIIPVPRMSEDKKISGVYFDFIEYSLDNHPVVEDLKTMIFFSESIVLDENSYMSEKAVQEIVENLSIQDNFYVEYLFDIAKELKLLKELPSVHSLVYVPCKNAEQYFEKSKREILGDIVYATIDIAAKNLNYILPLDDDPVTFEFLLDVLKKQQSVDDFFVELYARLDIEITDFWNAPFDEMNELEQSFIYSLYLVGNVFDRWFLTPLGRYLQLIVPNHLLEFFFDAELDDLVIKLATGTSYAIKETYFSPPPAGFCLTELGNSFFAFSEALNDYFKTQEDLEGFSDYLISQYLQGVNEFRKDLSEDIENCEIYELRVRMLEDKSRWQVLEVKDDQSLQMLHNGISKAFFLSTQSDYSFYMDFSFNRFTEIVSEKSTRRAKKLAEKTLIKDVFNEMGHKIAYRTDLDDIFNNSRLNQIYFELELLKKKEPKRGRIYPYISRISKAFKDDVRT